MLDKLNQNSLTRSTLIITVNPNSELIAKIEQFLLPDTIILAIQVVIIYNLALYLLSVGVK